MISYSICLPLSDLLDLHTKYFFNLNGKKAEMNNRTESGKFTNMWKLNNTIQGLPWWCSG